MHRLFFRAYATQPASIVIIDNNLSGENGLSICNHLRNLQSLGIIMTIDRGTNADCVRTIQACADAHLFKPVNLSELVNAVVKLINKINNNNLTSSSKPSGWALVEGGWVLTDETGHRLRLTLSEQRLLRCLFDNRGSIVERSTIVQVLGEDIYEYNYSHIDTIVSRLRRRADRAGIQIPLHTVRGKGFTFAD